VPLSAEYKLLDLWPSDEKQWVTVAFSHILPYQSCLFSFDVTYPIAYTASLWRSNKLHMKITVCGIWWQIICLTNTSVLQVYAASFFRVREYPCPETLICCCKQWICVITFQQTLIFMVTDMRIKNLAWLSVDRLIMFVMLLELSMKAYVGIKV
jgi:hypothetical protein